MIPFILLQNRQGKTRLAKYHVPFEESEKHKVEYEVHRLVVKRDPKFTNFVEKRIWRWKAWRRGWNLKELRQTFGSGKTRDAEWRKSQLRGLLRLLNEEEEEIFRLLHEDLGIGKHRVEAYRDEVGVLKKSVNFALENLDGWMVGKKMFVHGNAADCLVSDDCGSAHREIRQSLGVIPETRLGDRCIGTDTFKQPVLDS